MKSCFFITLVVLYSVDGRAETIEPPTFRVDVNMVLLDLSVKDARGRVVNGLQPNEVEVYENGVRQTIHSLVPAGETILTGRPGVPAETVFLLIDTSNAMYTEHAYAVDAIADFVRALDRRIAVAVYTFSRNLSRGVAPTLDRQQVLAAVYASTAGDDAALYNSLLLTIRDAANYPGLKRIVLVSNGLDNTSIVGPDDVARVAEDEGIPISILSTRPQGEISTAVFHRITQNTGGHLRVTPKWQRQGAEFAAILHELRNSYVVTYYSSNPSLSYRQISVRARDGNGRLCTVHTRRGYHPRTVASTETRARVAEARTRLSH